MIPKGFEWIVILIVVLVIFGPKNLPKLGKSLGSTVKNLREGMSGDDKTEEEPEESAEDREIRELEEGAAFIKELCSSYRAHAADLPTRAVGRYYGGSMVETALKESSAWRMARH